MKVLIDVPNNVQGQSFLKRTKALSYVQVVKKITTREVNILAEIAEIKRAYRLAAQVKAGKIKTRSARDLLNEL
jgi:hypothetical protein